jgi:hypothetical protein
MTDPDQMNAPQIGTGPVIASNALPEFDVADLESVRRAFERATPCSMGQAWQAAASPGFAPAVVRTGWRSGLFLVYAELADADIFSRATGPNQRFWELGDVFEIFLRPEGQEAYVELQVTPNNQRLQLRYADGAALDRARKTGSLAEALLPGDAFRSTTWLEQAASRWHVLAEIPARVVCGPDASLAGQRWRFSFSRYDYTRGVDEPVISSTSPHAEANFHSQREWGGIQFAGG